MTTSEKVGVAAGAVAVAAGLQRVYEVKRWTVPTPVWLGVTAGLTWLGWLGYRKLAR
jgi:hypothetical protein